MTTGNVKAVSQSDAKNLESCFSLFQLIDLVLQAPALLFWLHCAPN